VQLLKWWGRGGRERNDLQNEVNKTTNVKGNVGALGNDKMIKLKHRSDD
jgi:hypothetical protein